MGANSDGRDDEGDEQTVTVGVNVYQRDVDRVEDLIGQYGSRSAYVRDMLRASLDAHEAANKAGKPVMPHQIGDLIREAVEYYLENEE